MIVLPSGVVLGNNPRVGYLSILPNSTVSGPGAGLANLQNPATYLKWTGPAGAATISVLPGGDLENPFATTTDYLAIARHNFGTAGIEYTLEASDDGLVWTPIASGAPEDNSVIIHQYALTTANFYQLVLTEGSAPAQMAILYIGGLLTLERRIQVGHTPILYGRERDVSPGLSESGEFLGRVERARWYETAVRMENIDPVIYRTQIDPWLADITRPFFWAWRPQAWPLEVAYCWFKGEPSMSNQRPNGMVETSFGLQGIE